jgi:heterodisulfide reductase subunit A
MKKIGVFVCWCGSNIAETVDVDEVVKAISKLPGVVHAEHHEYMCSDPGQELIKRAIKEKDLDAIVVAACSPTLHEMTFRRTAEVAGLNPYQCEIANIREQCSWVHKDKRVATPKAIKIIKGAVEKVRLNESLSPLGVPITRRALIIGGGISGIQAALDIANGGYEVVLVERNPSIGGHMAQLSETFPTLDCAQCILTPRMVEVRQHPRIKLLTYSEVEEVKGHVGEFKVKVRRKAAYVDWEKCTGCGLCMQKCPVKVSSEFDRGMGQRKAIYTPFPQAVPNKPVIDRENCLYFKTGKCKICEKVCPVGAIDYEQGDAHLEEEVGAVIVATGYDLYPKEKIGEFGYGKYKDVIDGLAFERLLSATGPTGGEIRRPSDGRVPREIVFIQCAGSRETEEGVPYCSKICCMYTAKHAMLYKHRVPDGQAYVFYIDIRAGGKGYEEFVQRGIEEDKVLYLRGKVSKVFQEGDKIMVWGADTLTGEKVEIAADLVVLAPAMLPNGGAKELAKKLRIASDEYGFLKEAHPKLRPVESPTLGFYLAGCAQAPCDIPEAISQASGAASKVLDLFSGKELLREPTIASVDEDLCGGCGFCVAACPFEALELDPEGKTVKLTEALCEGCGACVASCPSGAIQLKNLRDRQILEMVKAIMGG